MNKFLISLREMRPFLTLYLTQELSALGSALTAFALVLWSYELSGSALSTALLTICSYAPYVLMSLFAGALSDRWNKKATLLLCDALAALTTLAVLVLLKTDTLRIWHLYVLNALNGLMNTVQGPASEVATTLLLPPRHYQRVGSLRHLSGSMTNILKPVLAAALMAWCGLEGVILIDLATFLFAAAILLFFIRIPKAPLEKKRGQEKLLKTVQSGLQYLAHNRGILHLIVFISLCNFVASVASAALPARIIPIVGSAGYGLYNTISGVVMLCGSLLATLLPAPKNRARLICRIMLFSMLFDYFLHAFGKSLWVWCFGRLLGWVLIPLMNTNYDALLRSSIPVEMQGRAHSVRTALEYLTIPLGYFAGGILVDRIFEPLIAVQSSESWLVLLFGSGQGAGASIVYLLLAVFGITMCLSFQYDRYIKSLN